MSTKATFSADNEIVVVNNLPFKLDDQGTLWIACQNIDDFVIDTIEISDDMGDEYEIEISDAHLAKARELMTYDLAMELGDAMADQSTAPYAWMLEGYDDADLANLTSDDVLKYRAEQHIEFGMDFEYDYQGFEEVWKIFVDTTDYEIATTVITKAIDNAKLTQVMTASEVSTEFNITRQAVHDAINAGRITSRQSGQTHLMLRKDVERLWKALFWTGLVVGFLAQIAH